MSVSRNDMLNTLHNAYTVYFDDVTPEEPAEPLAACYAFHSTNECFVISKKVKLWSAETNEYVYVFSLPTLNAEQYEACCRLAHEQGMRNIRPHIDHRSSNITAVFICDSIDEEAAKALEKTKIRKDFLFSLHGWMEFRTAAVELSAGRIFVNRAAADLKEFLHGNLEKSLSRRN